MMSLNSPGILLVLLLLINALTSCGHRQLITVPATEIESTGTGRMYIVSDGPNGPRGWLVHEPSMAEEGVIGDLKDLTMERSKQVYGLDSSTRKKYMANARIVYMKYDWLPRRRAEGNVLIPKDSMLKLVHVKPDPDKGAARTFILIFALATVAGVIVILK